MKQFGHPQFYKLLDELAELHAKKNAQYASQSNPLGNFQRTAKLADKLFKPDINKPLAMALCYMAKQVDAVYDIVGENKKNTVDSLEDKLKDIAVYALLCIILSKTDNN